MVSLQYGFIPKLPSFISFLLPNFYSFLYLVFVVLFDEEITHSDEQFLHSCVFLFQGSKSFLSDVLDLGDGFQGTLKFCFVDFGFFEDLGTL